MDIREQIVQKARTYIGTPYSQLDCSAFVRAVFRNFGIEFPRVSDDQGKWLYDKGLATKIPVEMKIADIISLLQIGDTLYWSNPNYPTRWLHIHHTAIYIGNGKMIESCGAGVHESSLWETTKWQYILYGNPVALITNAQPQETEVEEVIKKGDIGENVKAWQRALIAAGYALPKWGADGDFGTETETATKAFQLVAELPQTGIVDVATACAMFNVDNFKITDLSAKIEAVKKALA